MSYRSFVNRIRFAAALALTLAFSGLPAAEAFMRDYTPISAADKKHAIAVKTVKDIGLRNGKVLNLSGIEVKLTDDEDADIQFCGIDASKKPWKLTKHYYGLGTALYLADLDRNGVQDIVLLQATGACGIAPPAVLTTILFDSQKRPMPLEVSGYFNATDDDWGESKTTTCIEDLITLGKDKHAILICNQLDSAQVNGRYRSYWRTILYRADRGRWVRLPSYQKKRLPLLVRYTYKPNHKVIPDAVPALSKFDDGGFDATRVRTGVISKFELDENNNVKSLVISPESFLKPLQWSFFSPFIIRETAAGREIFELSTRQGKALLTEASTRKAHARYLQPTMTQLFPTYIWLSD